MKISKIPGLGTFGHYIDDVDFNHITDEEWFEIGKLHLKGLVTILRNVNISKDQFHERIKQFGPFKSYQRKHMVMKYGHDFDSMDPKTYADFDEKDRDFVGKRKYQLEETEGGKFLMRITGRRDADGNSMGIFDHGELGWHSNESSVLTFAPGVALLGYAHMRESSTGFMQTVDYYNSLSESFRSELDEMIVTHRHAPGRVNARELEDEYLRMSSQLNFVPVDGAETPLVITSPGGHRGLHYTINSLNTIKGMSVEESNKVFKEIDRHLFAEDNVYDHWYQNNNDLLLFDNSVTLHRRIGGHPERMAFRLQYDYCNLIDSPWHPFSQPEFDRAYVAQIRDLVEVLDIKNYNNLP
jgi:alpha-ketoglutarate-dependent taurine dioxygenase